MYKKQIEIIDVEQGNERTLKIKNNVFLSIISKFGNALCVFLLVPLTINYLNPVEYGIWITLTSITTWLSMFDIGFGNGLKNRLAETFSFNDKI